MIWIKISRCDVYIVAEGRGFWQEKNLKKGRIKKTNPVKERIGMLKSTCNEMGYMLF